MEKRPPNETPETDALREHHIGKAFDADCDVHEETYELCESLERRLIAAVFQANMMQQRAEAAERGVKEGWVMVPGLNEAMDWLVSYSGCVIDIQRCSDEYQAGWNDGVKGCIDSIQDALKIALSARERKE